MKGARSFGKLRTSCIALLENRSRSEGRRPTRRTEIDSRGAAALWFRLEIRLKSNNPDQK